MVDRGADIMTTAEGMASLAPVIAAAPPPVGFRGNIRAAFTVFRDRGGAPTPSAVKVSAGPGGVAAGGNAGDIDNVRIEARIEATGAAAGSPGVAVAGDVASSFSGAPHVTPHRIVAGLRAPDPARQAEALDLIRATLPEGARSRFDAVVSFFRLPGREAPAGADLHAEFAAAAQPHLTLIAELEACRAPDAEIEALRGKAPEAVKNGDHAAAAGFYAEALRTGRPRRAETQEASAKLRVEAAEVERARFAFAAAAPLFDEAAGLTPAADAGRPAAATCGAPRRPGGTMAAAAA